MNLTKLFLGALAALSLSATANAAYVPATWSDPYDVGTGVYIGQNDSYQYTHDITLDGFNPGTDLVTSFLLSVSLKDDASDPWLSPVEIAIVDLPGIFDTAYVYNFGANAYQGWSLAGIIELNAFGTLSVTISSLLGDFVFAGSNLVAHGIAKTTEVPEPATLGIFGLGLLGIAAAARRRRAK